VDSHFSSFPFFSYGFLCPPQSLLLFFSISYRSIACYSNLVYGWNTASLFSLPPSCGSITSPFFFLLLFIKRGDWEAISAFPLLSGCSRLPSPSFFFFFFSPFHLCTQCCLMGCVKKVLFPPFSFSLVPCASLVLPPFPFLFLSFG